MVERKTGLALVVGCLFAASSCGGCQPSEGIITDRDFSIDFPSHWEVKEKQDNMAIFGRSPQEGASDWYRENVNVVIEGIPGDMSLDDYYSLALANMRRMLDGVEILGKADATVGGQDAKNLVYTHATQHRQVKVLAFFLVKDGRGYVIKCTAAPERFDQYKDTFATVVDSLRFD